MGRKIRMAQTDSNGKHLLMFQWYIAWYWNKLNIIALNECRQRMPADENFFFFFGAKDAKYKCLHLKAVEGKLPLCLVWILLPKMLLDWNMCIAHEIHQLISSFFSHFISKLIQFSSIDKRNYFNWMWFSVICMVIAKFAKFCKSIHFWYFNSVNFQITFVWMPKNWVKFKRNTQITFN